MLQEVLLKRIEEMNKTGEKKVIKDLVKKFNNISSKW